LKLLLGIKASEGVFHIRDLVVAEGVVQSLHLEDRGTQLSEVVVGHKSLRRSQEHIFGEFFLSDFLAEEINISQLLRSRGAT